MAKFKNPRQIVAQGGPPAISRPMVPDIIEPRCRVCTHPQRREIDMMLALGWSQADVIRHWNQVMELVDTPEEERFKRNGMSVHANRHLSIKDSAIRRIIEARARIEGIDSETVEGFILTKTGVTEALVASGLESLHRGDTMVEPKDILAAIKTLTDIERDRSAEAEEVMLREIKAFTTAVKRVVPEEMWDEIYAAYEGELGRVNLAIMPTLIEADIIIEAEEIEEEEDGRS